MTTTTETIRNGVDTATLFGTLDAIKDNPDLATFQFRVSNRWIEGAHNRSSIKGFYGGGGEDTTRTETFQLVSGEPQVLLGTDTGPNPAEYLLHALAGCLTTSLVYVAAARGVQLTEVTSTLEGNMDLRGALGLDVDYRNGFTDIKVKFSIKGNASDGDLEALMERAYTRSAVFDMISNGVPIEVEVETP
ncbi:MAG TPA: OsmC family protein [Acidimicrobiia bacterium]|nr:OsmC family protein [Acidimicrobiia bacterium]